MDIKVLQNAIKLLCSDSQTITECVLNEDETKPTMLTKEIISTENLTKAILNFKPFEQADDEWKKKICGIVFKTEPNADKYRYCYEYLLQEMHNRMCKSLNMEPTVVHFLKFTEENGLSPTSLFCTSKFDNEIYINSTSFIFQGMPIYFLLQELSGLTFERKYMKNAKSIMKDADKSTDIEKFCMLTALLHNYNWIESIDNGDLPESSCLEGYEHYSPSAIISSLDAFDMVEKLMKKAKINNDEVWKTFENDKNSFYDYIADELCVYSLKSLKLELMALKTNPNNAISNGKFLKIFYYIINNLGKPFYNSLGADIKENQDLLGFIKEIDEELLEQFPDEDLYDEGEEDVESEEEYDEEYGEEYDENDLEEYDEEEFDDIDEQDDEYYDKMSQQSIMQNYMSNYAELAKRSKSWMGRLNNMDICFDTYKFMDGPTYRKMRNVNPNENNFNDKKDI